MKIILKKNLVKADPSPEGNRYCTNCSQTRNSINGFWKITLNGKTRRWICKSCVEIRFK
jgi:hypothetical protein